jgi:hypothetical protein
MADGCGGGRDDEGCAEAAEEAEDDEEVPVLWCGMVSEVDNVGRTGRGRFCDAPVYTPMSMILAIINTLPTKTRTRGPLASKTGPIKTPHRKVRKM